MRRLLIGLLSIAVVTIGMAEVVDNEAHAGFSYNAAGDLVAGSGEGNPDSTVHVSDMRFPIEEAPAYANSQVWGHGGMEGPAGGECHSNNYSYPWYDNFCETRWKNASFCPGSGDAHQGQDIRPATCDDRTYTVVAAKGGTVTNIGSYSVWIQDSSGMTHRYLHVAMDALEVSQGQTVDKGQPIGLVSDDFGGNATTIHLHYDINQGGTYLNPYMSLVESYQNVSGSSAPQPSGDSGGSSDSSGSSGGQTGQTGGDTSGDSSGDNTGSFTTETSSCSSVNGAGGTGVMLVVLGIFGLAFLRRRKNAEYA